jgi:PAS domain S-box-containing protein
VRPEAAKEPAVLGMRSAVPVPDIDPYAASLPDEVLDAAGVGVWRVDLGTRRIEASARFGALLGYVESPVDTSLSALERHIDVEDLPAFRAAWEALETGGRLHCEIRARRRDGRIMWIALHGHANGRRAAGVALDITDQRAGAILGPDAQTRLESLFEVGSVGFAQADPLTGRLLHANAHLSEMLGYPRGHLVGRRTISLTHPADRAGQVEGMQRLLRGEIPSYEAEMRLLRRDGGTVWVLMTVGLTRDAIGTARITTAVVINISDRKRAELVLVEREEQFRLSCEELEDRLEERSTELAAATEALHREIEDRRAAEQRVRELLGRHVQAIEDERGRISRELHDTLGQHLAALGIGLKMMDDNPGSPGAARLQKLREVLAQLEDEIDRLSHELRPPALDELGLEDALNSYAQAWSQDSGVVVEVHTHGLRTGRLPSLVETTVYRVVQEALTNVRKHAHATRVGLIVERRLDELRMVVEDDGGGFDSARTGPDAGRHWGLRSMAERAMLVAGQFQVESSPDNGTTVYLAIPVRADGEPVEHET